MDKIEPKWLCARVSCISWHKVEGKRFIFVLWKFVGGICMLPDGGTYVNTVELGYNVIKGT
jgi:hypothetical protein